METDGDSWVVISAPKLGVGHVNQAFDNDDNGVPLQFKVSPAVLDCSDMVAVPISRV